MFLDLEGRTAYLTGGAMGIGAAGVAALLSEGMTVAVADIDGEQLEKQANEFEELGSRIHPIVADLSTLEGCLSAAETALNVFGGAPDVLVNNVGTALVRPFEQLTDQDWLDTLNLNFMSYVRTCRVILPAMQANGQGVIVNIASDLGKQPEPAPADYSASKAAVLSLTKSLALQYAPYIRCNAICPGPIWTNLWTRPGGFADSLGELYGLPPEAAVEKFISDRHLPLNRIGEPADVAALILFLASPVSKYVTGSAFSVDGGSVRSLV
jgi:NAD(P)-dependent dehydrogenase (short-subunit alcohol dehydrogenase family)